jgi:hypothetical protein
MCTVKFEFDSDPTFIADYYCKDCQCGAMVTFSAFPNMISR